jgi:hypothetical protein
MDFELVLRPPIETTAVTVPIKFHFKWTRIRLHGSLRHVAAYHNRRNNCLQRAGGNVTEIVVSTSTGLPSTIVGA